MQECNTFHVFKIVQMVQSIQEWNQVKFVEDSL